MGRSVAIEALEPERDVDQARDLRLGVARGLKLRLALDRLRKRHRVRRVVGHELAQPIDLAIGQTEHAPDVAQGRTRLEFAERDDLRDALAAIALGDVFDHPVAVVLTEIDVEVRHRHALGIEEALEQEPEAQGVEVGDLQRPGDHGAGARAAPRPDRDAIRLCAPDEVGDDQEIAGKFHRDDDIELIGQPITVGLCSGVLCGLVQPRLQHLGGETNGEPFFRPLAQEIRLAQALIAREGRENGRARRHFEGAAPGDHERVVERIGQIGEQRAHLLG